MSDNLCIETICVENRVVTKAGYHNARLNKTRKDLWGYDDVWDIEPLFPVPEQVSNQRHKLRIAYGKIVEDVKWEVYVPRTIKKIRRVYDVSVDYSYKYNNREKLNSLFEQRKDADEILIIKNGMVTDSFYCNVAFFDGSNWLTPTSNLLPGVQRSFLLDSGVISEAIITEKQISDFSHIRLFNALVDWNQAPELEVGLID